MAQRPMIGEAHHGGRDGADARARSASGIGTRRRRRGATLVEALLLIGMVALIGAAGYRTFGEAVRAKIGEQAARVLDLEPVGSGSSPLATVEKPSTGPAPTSGAPGGGGPPAPPAPGAFDGLKSAAQALVACSDGSCVGSDQCFVAGTPVATPDGPRAIETLRAGDLVLARDEHTGVTAFKPVVRTFLREQEEVVDLELVRADGAAEIIGVTPGHRVWVDGVGWREVEAIPTGASGYAATSGGVSFGAATLRAERASVYNIEVEGFHTYFVGNARAWVHNDCLKPEDVKDLLGRLPQMKDAEIEAKLGRVLEGPAIRGAVEAALERYARDKGQPPDLGKLVKDARDAAAKKARDAVASGKGREAMLDGLKALLDQAERDRLAAERMKLAQNFGPKEPKQPSFERIRNAGPEPQPPRRGAVGMPMAGRVIGLGGLPGMAVGNLPVAVNDALNPHAAAEYRIAYEDYMRRHAHWKKTRELIERERRELGP